MLRSWSGVEAGEVRGSQGWVEKGKGGHTMTTILSIILASDKTHLTNFTGDKSMHAIYMSLGNIHKDV